MSQIEDIIAKAMSASKAWPVVFEAGSAAELARAAVAALDAAGFVVVPKEPTEEMLRAGMQANQFVNDHNGEPGCPGVPSPPLPADAFDADMMTCIDPAKLEAWKVAPKCLIARVTLPPDRPWRAMIDARPK